MPDTSHRFNGANKRNRLLTEVGATNSVVAQECGRGVLIEHVSVFQHVTTVSDSKRLVSVLLDEHDRYTFGPNGFNDLENGRNNHRR